MEISWSRAAGLARGIAAVLAVTSSTLSLSIFGSFRKADGMSIRALIISTITFSVIVGRANAQDPAVVNAKTIKVKFENDRVRVMEATLPPGVKEQVHSHPAYVIYVLEGGRYRNYASDGKVTEGELKTGEVLFRESLTHAAENIGDKPLHMILVELKGETGTKTPAQL
jgi:quercetin dioxygenase-like cupin family protein